MAIGTIASGVIGVSKTLGFDPIDAVQNIFGGGRQSAGCKERQAEVARIFEELFTPAELAQHSRVLDRMESSDHGDSPNGLAYEYIGGRDCKIQNDGKRRWVAYMDRQMQAKIDEREAQAQASQGWKPGDREATATTQAGAGITNSLAGNNWILWVLLAGFGGWIISNQLK